MAEDDKTEGLLDDAKKDTGNLAELVETLRENNAMTSNVEADQRNTRRHLLEMKKHSRVSAHHLINLDYMFEDLLTSMGVQFNKWDEPIGDDQQEAEDKAEQLNIFEEIRDSIKNQTTEAGQETAKAATGMMGKLGKMLGGVGIGVGAAGVGIAAVMGAGAYLLGQLEDMDAGKIKENVVELLSISDAFGGESGEGKFVNMFKETGSFYVMMLGLGAGLAAFSIGAGAASIVQSFQTEGWTGTIKQNVIELLSIPNEAGGGGMGGGILAVGKSGVFALSMAGLGLGLAAFGIGSAVGGLGNAIGEFVNKDDWAATIKRNVLTLLSIADSGGGDEKVLGDTGTFFWSMTGLGLGLAAFAIGKAGSGVADALTTFQGENFAEDIKAEVETLLSIGRLPGAGDPAIMDAFGFTMLGLSMGLAAFAIGKGAAGVADFLTLTTPGSNFAEDVKEEVETLLSIGKDVDQKHVALAMLALSELGVGLGLFATGKGLNALADIGQGIVSFFTGEKSPITQAMMLADRAEELDKGVQAFDRFGDVLQRFAGIDDLSVDWELEEMAEDLLKASNLLNIAIAGGTDYRGINQDYVGISNIEGMDEALENIALLKSAFTIEIPTTGIDMTAAALENADQQGGGSTIVTTDASDSSITSSNQTNIISQPIDQTTLGLTQATSGPGQ